MYVQIQAQTLAANILLKEFERRKKNDQSISLSDIEIKLEDFHKFQLKVLSDLGKDDTTVFLISLEDSEGGGYIDYTRFFKIDTDNNVLKIADGVVFEKMLACYGVLNIELSKVIDAAFDSVFEKVA